MRHVEKLSAKNVLDFYKEGDALAVKTMEKVGDILGSTLAVFACVTDPELSLIHILQGRHMYRSFPFLDQNLWRCSLA